MWGPTERGLPKRCQPMLCSAKGTVGGANFGGEVNVGQEEELHLEVRAGCSVLFSVPRCP